MGLTRVTDIRQVTRIGDAGDLVPTMQVEFQTEETSGVWTVEIPADEFSPDLAQARARQRAEEIDAAFTGGDNGGR